MAGRRASTAQRLSLQYWIENLGLGFYLVPRASLAMPNQYSVTAKYSGSGTRQEFRPLCESAKLLASFVTRDPKI